MDFTIQWIGEVFLGLSSDGGRQIGMSLLESQPVPAEFKEGDRVRIATSQHIPYEPGVEPENRYYYTVTHIPTGKTFTVWHDSDDWRLERRKG
jgi:hypothetical protein